MPGLGRSSLMRVRSRSRFVPPLSSPELLNCEELYGGLHDARLWMSLGNTSSSLHFDTHENLLVQLDGDKEVLLWHPNETANFYMDFHEKYGLSPVQTVAGPHESATRLPHVSSHTSLYTSCAFALSVHTSIASRSAPHFPTALCAH